MKDLLLSRQFWAALMMLVVIIIAAFVPGFKLDWDLAAGFLIIIVMYIVGVSVDPGPAGWRGWIQSRKFWAAVIGLLILFLDGFGVVLPFALTPEQLITFAVTIGGLIAGWAFQPLPAPG